jgi:hypothetical protein
VRLVNVEESIATPRTFVQVDRLSINTPLAAKQPIPTRKRDLEAPAIPRWGFAQLRGAFISR